MTNGGGGLRRWAPLAIATGLLTIAVAGNVASTLDHQVRAGEAADLFVPVLDEISSALVWLALLPIIVRTFKTFAPPRFPWTVAVPLHLAAAALVSLVHYGLTRLLRAGVYLALGQGFNMPMAWNGYTADLYKDVLNYVLFGLIYWGAEMLFAARGKPEAVEPAPILEVKDGAQTLYLPIAEILWCEAAGNYVELHATGGRDILMRATLASLAQRLEAARFLRVHRSRLVNTAFISAIENQPAGDAIVVLNNGSRITASRRYRPALVEALGNRAMI